MFIPMVQDINLVLFYLNDIKVDSYYIDFEGKIKVVFSLLWMIP